MSSQQRRGERRKKCTRGEFAASSAAMTFDDDTFGVKAFVLLLAVFEGVCFGRVGSVWWRKMGGTSEERTASAADERRTARGLQYRVSNGGARHSAEPSLLRLRRQGRHQRSSVLSSAGS